ncbi:HSP18 transcriptional regulator, partial [Streptomyces sp. NPDC051366]
MKETTPPTPQVSFLAAAAALETIDQAVRNAQQSPAGTPTAQAAPVPATGPHPALAALLVLREVREQLAGWESGLIETARGQGASWADLAGPLGVASRQAAERRYLRLRPGTAGSTGEQRV